jgi:hypothetical protein
VKAPRNQVFLEQRSYRLRRLGDAARLLPVLGLILCLLPLFWGPETAGKPRATAWDGVYLFAVWLGLILCAAILARRLLPVATKAAGRGAEDETALTDARAGE